jgi:hypothetical protein
MIVNILKPEMSIARISRALDIRRSTIYYARSARIEANIVKDANKLFHFFHPLDLFFIRYAPPQLFPCFHLQAQG